MIFKNSRNRIRAEKFLGLFALVIVSLLFVYWQLNTIRDKLRDSILNIQVIAINDFAKNAENLFMQNFDDEGMEQILQSKEILDDIENSLEILNSKSYKFIYILYKSEKDNRYRFLLDSSLHQKERRNSTFPVGDDLDIYDDTIDGENHKLIFQTDSKNSFNLYVTYVKPIKISSSEIALFSLDFSVDLEKVVKHIVGNIKNSIVFLIFLLSLVLLGLLILVIKAILDQDKAFLDDLTNTYNRKYLTYLTKKENLGEKYSVMLLDIDYFKKVNDTYGHQVGDYVLIDVVSSVKSCVNADDILVRYGGEEFLLLVKNRDKDICDSISQRILSRVENHITKTSKYEIKTTISIGVNVCNQDREDIFVMIKNADEALYVSKRNGRNQAIFYDCKDKPK